MQWRFFANYCIVSGLETVLFDALQVDQLNILRTAGAKTPREKGLVLEKGLTFS